MSKESMMSGYTRGPWGFGNTARYERMILGDGGKGRYVCHVTVEQSRGGIIAQSMEAEREANARLIAAAPDLLEALRLALPYVEDASDSASPADQDFIRAAIAKATAQSGEA